jgi:flagellar export protein FliJ
VKRFEFGLARALDFRRQQLELEEAKLEILLAERGRLDADSLRIDNEVDATRQSLMVTGSAQSQELVAADLYLGHLAAEKKRQAAKLADWQQRASKQHKAMVEVRRRVRLLEKLKEKQFQTWKAETDREQENLSAELFLARWKK